MSENETKIITARNMERRYRGLAEAEPEPADQEHFKALADHWRGVAESLVTSTWSLKK